MKIFLTWLILAVAVFAGLGAFQHFSLTQDPRRVAVVVDSSFPMSSAWDRVPRLLRGLDDERYTLYSLLTEKSSVHGWKTRLDLGQLSPYGPRKFEKLLAADFPELAEADQVYLVTNSPATELTAFDDWEILRP